MICRQVSRETDDPRRRRFPGARWCTGRCWPTAARAGSPSRAARPGRRPARRDRAGSSPSRPRASPTTPRGHASPPTSTRRCAAPTSSSPRSASAASRAARPTSGSPWTEGVLGQETVGAGRHRLRAAHRAGRRRHRPARRPARPRRLGHQLHQPGRPGHRGHVPPPRRPGHRHLRLAGRASAAGSPAPSAPTREQAWLDYAGLNHLGWLRGLRVDGPRRTARGCSPTPSCSAPSRRAGSSAPTGSGRSARSRTSTCTTTTSTARRCAPTRRPSRPAAPSSLEQQARFYAEMERARTPRRCTTWDRTRAEREATYMAREPRGGRRRRARRRATWSPAATRRSPSP